MARAWKRNESRFLCLCEILLRAYCPNPTQRHRGHRGTQSNTKNELDVRLELTPSRVAHNPTNHSFAVLCDLRASVLGVGLELAIAVRFRTVSRNTAPRMTNAGPPVVSRTRSGSSSSVHGNC